MSRKKTLHSPRVRRLIAFSAVIMLVFCFLIGYQATVSYDKAIDYAKAGAQRLSEMMSEQIQTRFLSVDLTMRRAVERDYFNQLFGGKLPQDLQHNFRIWVEENPHVAAMMLVNKKGDVAVAAHKPEYAGWLDYSDSLRFSPLFSHMHEANDKPFYIGENNTLASTNPHLIYMTRKVVSVEGAFDGAIVAAIDVRALGDFLEAINQSDGRFLALLLENGSQLYAGPEQNIVNEARMLAWLSQSVRTRSEKGEKGQESFVTSATLHGDVHVVAMSDPAKIPLTVAIVVEEENVLRSWRSGRVRDITFLVIFLIFGSVLSFFALTMARQIVRVEESESAAILASQAKSEFLANMSHELRTPLNAIIGFSEMMQAGYFGELNAKLSERVRDIHLCGSHLLQLITDILEFSKGEAGRLEVHEEVFTLEESIGECTRMLHEKARAKMIDVEMRIAEGVPKFRGDKRKIRQVLINLLSNAIKFTPEYGKVILAVDQGLSGELALTVTDTGVGIAEDQIPTALAVFGQVHRNKSHEGTGLGLPLCKMFTELHGGTMTITSTVGKGTSVRLLFPKDRAV